MFSSSPKDYSAFKIFSEEFMKEAVELKPYLNNFDLYYSDTGYIFRIKINNFYKMTKTYDYTLDASMVELFPFIKSCNDDCLEKYQTFLWSSDGKNFYQMQQIVPSEVGDVSNIAWFKTNTPNQICRFKFTSDKALLLEPKLLEQKVQSDSLKSSMVFEIKFNNTPYVPPVHKSIAEFKLAPRKFLNFLLQDLSAEKIKIFPFINPLTPKYLFQTSDDKMLLVANIGTKVIFKWNESHTWTDIAAKSVSGVMDGSGSLHALVSDLHHFKNIEIINPNKDTNKMIIELRDGRIIQGKKIPLTETYLQSMASFITKGSNASYQTPLDTDGLEVSKKCTV